MKAMYILDRAKGVIIINGERDLQISPKTKLHLYPEAAGRFFKVTIEEIKTKQDSFLTKWKKKLLPKKLS